MGFRQFPVGIGFALRARHRWVHRNILFFYRPRNHAIVHVFRFKPVFYSFLISMGTVLVMAAPARLKK